MDALELAQLKHQFLGEMAASADDRIRALLQEALLHRGGGQHLGALAGLIEGHRVRLGERLAELAASDPADAPSPEAVETKAHIAGITDALAYLRAQSRAAELSASQADAALQEAQRNRASVEDLRSHQDGKVAQFMAQVDAGTPREELGRPATAEQVRDQINERRAAVDAAAVPPKKRGRGRPRKDQAVIRVS